MLCSISRGFQAKLNFITLYTFAMTHSAMWNSFGKGKTKILIDTEVSKCYLENQ